ncbi:MAG: LapA family protein [Rhodoferax sp.]|jgi:uncharacterized integral membrane protein
MKQFVWLFKWLLKAAIFFTLFAFALNNQGDVTVHFFFGTRWTAPMVLVVLIIFSAGVAIGVLGMVPRWWRHRNAAKQARMQIATTPATMSAEAEKPPTLPTHGL